MSKKFFLMEETPTGWRKAEGFELSFEAGPATPVAPATFVAPTPPPPPPPTPTPTPRVMGYAVGDCHTYTKEGKTVFNREVWKAGFRWNANLKCSRPVRYRDGMRQAFTVLHYGDRDIIRRVA